MIKAALTALVFTFALAMNASVAYAEMCSESAETPAIQIKSRIEVPETDLRAQIATSKAHFMKAPSAAWTAVTLSGRSLYNSLTQKLARFQSNPYPWTYISDGTVPLLRLWSKTADKDSQETVEGWIKRYKDYPMYRRLEIERTVFVRAHAEMLEKLLKRPDSDFPVEMMVPKFIRQGLRQDKMVLMSKLQVKREINELKTSEFARFNSISKLYYRKGWFLRGKDFSQAQLEARLRIAVTELKKPNIPLRDPEKAKEFITEIQALLDNPELRSTPGARYVEARRALTDEIKYYSGNHELGATASELLENKVWEDDLFSLGIDPEGVSPTRRLLRKSIVHSPKIFGAALLLMYAPTMKYEFKVLFEHEVLMHEIADLPQIDYEKKSYEYLRYVYGTHLEGGAPVLNSTAKDALSEFKDMRAEHVAELRKERISEQEYAMELKTPEDETRMSAAQFKALMETPAATFTDRAKAFAAKAESTQAKRDALVQRLSDAYLSVQDPAATLAEDAPGKRKHLSSDNILKSVLTFVTGGGGDSEGGD